MTELCYALIVAFSQYLLSDSLIITTNRGKTVLVDTILNTKILFNLIFAVNYKANNIFAIHWISKRELRSLNNMPQVTFKAAVFLTTTRQGRWPSFPINNKNLTIQLLNN